MDFQAEEQRAQEYLVSEQRVTNAMRLTRIALQRLRVDQITLERHRLDPLRFTNHWYLDLMFQPINPAPVKPPPRFRHVVALLDGSYADEEEVTPTDRLPQAERVTHAPLGRDLPSRSSPHGRAVAAHPLEKLQSADFVPVAVQWNPQTEALPLDLTEALRRAKISLVGEEGMDPTYSLELLEIFRYVPTASLLARRQDLASHQYHWALHFRFTAPEKSGRHETYAAYQLLDGATLGLVRQAPAVPTTK